MRIPTRDLFAACYGKYAIAAVNVFSMEQVLALFQAADRAKAPFIVQMTPYARDYASPLMLENMIQAASTLYPNTVFATHLDHGNEQHCQAAIQSGHYSSVMIDASHDPFPENISRTRSVVHLASQSRVDVEAELGVLSGVEDDITIDARSAFYTDPEQCESFVVQTGCSSLAVAVGTSHGAYKFSGNQGLQFDILQQIKDRLPGFPLVLHGGSRVEAREVSRINAAGGSMQTSAKGVDPDELQQAISLGICKVNIATDTRLIWARVHREFFRDQPESIDLVIPGKTHIAAYADWMCGAFERLGAAGKSTDFIS